MCKTVKLQLLTMSKLNAIKIEYLTFILALRLPAPNCIHFARFNFVVVQIQIVWHLTFVICNGIWNVIYRGRASIYVKLVAFLCYPHISSSIFCCCVLCEPVLGLHSNIEKFIPRNQKKCVFFHFFIVFHINILTTWDIQHIFAAQRKLHIHIFYFVCILCFFCLSIFSHRLGDICSIGARKKLNYGKSESKREKNNYQQDSCVYAKCSTRRWYDRYTCMCFKWLHVAGFFSSFFDKMYFFLHFYLVSLANGKRIAGEIEVQKKTSDDA